MSCAALRPRAGLRIAVLDDYTREARSSIRWNRLRSVARIDFSHRHTVGEDSLAAALSQYQVIATMRERTPFGSSLLQRLPQLKLLCTTGTRNDSIDLDAATDLGVVVCGTDGRSHPTAELTLGLIIALARDLVGQSNAIRGAWWQTQIGIELRDKNMGILGLGNIGARVAKLASAFGMRPLAWSENLTHERASASGATLVTRDDLFRESDFVSLHLRLSDRTRGTVGMRELGLMKPTAFLVNTSRSPIIDEAALLHALERRFIAGAALDVFDEEPLPASHPLMSIKNLLLTPHLGYATKETFDLYYAQTVENIEAFHAGVPIRVMNPAVL